MSDSGSKYPPGWRSVSGLTAEEFEAVLKEVAVAGEDNARREREAFRTMPIPREEQRIAALEREVKELRERLAIADASIADLRQECMAERQRRWAEQTQPATEREDAVFAAGYVTAYRALCQIPPRSTEIRGAVREWVEGGRKTHLDEGQQAGTEQLDEGQ